MSCGVHSTYVGPWQHRRLCHGGYARHMPAHCVLRTTHCVSRTAHCGSRTAHCASRTAHCVLLTTHCASRTAQCVFRTTTGQGSAPAPAPCQAGDGCSQPLELRLSRVETATEAVEYHVSGVRGTGGLGEYRIRAS